MNPGETYEEAVVRLYNVGVGKDQHWWRDPNEGKRNLKQLMRDINEAHRTDAADRPDEHVSNMYIDDPEHIPDPGEELRTEHRVEGDWHGHEDVSGTMTYSRFLELIADTHIDVAATLGENSLAHVYENLLTAINAKGAARRVTSESGQPYVR